MIEISVEDIEAKLQTHYSGRQPRDRNLHIMKCHDNHGVIGSVYFSLDGSPPKGSAVYLIDHYRLNLYDIEGRRFKQYMNVVVTGLDQYKDVDMYPKQENNP